MASTKSRVALGLALSGWTVCAWLGLKTLAALLVVAGLVSTRLPAWIAWEMLSGSWRVPAFAAGSIGAVALGVRLARLRWGGLPIGWLWMGGTVLLFSLSTALRACGSPRQPNRYGFYPSLAPSAKTTLRDPRPNVPQMTIATNALGYRDRAWRLDGASDQTRVLLVGDSFVFGHGIADESGLLSRQLELALDASGDGPWEVLNAGMSPAGLWYYAQAIERIAPEMRPRIAVMSFLKAYDASSYDDQWVKTGLAPPLVKLMTDLGLLHDYMAAAKGIGESINRGFMRADDMAASRRVLGELVATLERMELPLIVWMPLGDDAVFEPMRRHRLISFVQPNDVLELGGRQAWTQDPALCIPGDGHPTSRGNQLFARGLSRVIRERVRRAGG